MHDLRKKTLVNSGKTVSRKARSKPEETKSARSTPTPSPALTPRGSRPGSRFNSRPTSRVNTDDEAGDSVDDHDATSQFSESDDEDDDLTHNVRGLLASLQDRKHNSAQEREDTLNAYIHLLRRHYLQPTVQDEIDGLIPALRRSIRSGGSTRECSLAIKALCVTSVTFPSDRYFEDVYDTLKALVQESEDEDIKAEATRALGILVSCSAVDSSISTDLLDFLVEIVESDGAQVDAHDSVPVVVAALRTWAFVAAQLVGNLSSHMDMEQAMETFTDQLDSTEPEVQASAGTNIALLFESARLAKEQDSAEDDHDENLDHGHVDASASFDLDFQYNRHKIVTRISEIMRDSSRLVSRKQKRDLRSTFTSILTSLERGKGPGYSTVLSREFSCLGHESENALDSGIQKEMYEEGYRERFRVNQHVLVIDTWATKVKLETMKAILGTGLGLHYCENPFAQTLLRGPSEKATQKISKTWTSAMRVAARKATK